MPPYVTLLHKKKSADVKNLKIDKENGKNR